MKKYLLSLVIMMMGASLFISCLGDNKDDNDTIEYVVTKGALVINNGNAYNGIDGSLTHIDFSTNPATAQQNVFKKANGISLGGTPNDVMVYGDKIYIAGSDENAVFVLNKKTFKLLERISTTDDMGETEGVNPRSLTGYGSKVYVSTYGGYVGVIDTLTLSIDNKMYKVGSTPEGLAIGTVSNGTNVEAFLYVANSDYSYGNGSISKINLSDGQVTTTSYEGVKNPQEIAVAGDILYVLDWGSYDENYNQVGAGVYKISGNSVTKIVPDATGMAAAGQLILTFNSPYGSNKTTYSVYNIAYNILDTFTLTGDSSHPIISPSAISIEPNNSYVYIASRPIDPDKGTASFTLPGFVNVYDLNGNFLGSFNAGVEPHKIAFSYGIAKLEY